MSLDPSTWPSASLRIVVSPLRGSNHDARRVLGIMVSPLRESNHDAS